MDTPKIVITGSPDWAGPISERLVEAGYEPVRYTDTDRYLHRLTEDHAALVLVDGAGDDWEFFTTSPKVNAATRRIPVVVIAADDAIMREAYTAGADLCLRPADVEDRLGVILSEHTRQQSTGEAARLRKQCEDPLPPLARQGVEQFNNGAYYRQHDSFEELWMEETGPVRDLYRAILQVGIAYYQVERGNPRGALKMILRSIQWLNILPDVCQGVDVARLRADALRLRDALEALPEDFDMADFDRSLLGQVHLVDQ